MKLLNPRFFKVIVPPTLDNYKLVLPRKFVRNYGNDFEDSVFLKAPSGDEWRVDLVRSGYDVYFGNGLEKFLKHYSVDYGHFIVFEYRSKSCFGVVLLDTSATEVDYPVLVNASRRPCPDEKSEDDDWVVIISDDGDLPLPYERKRADVAFEFSSASKLATSVTVGGNVTEVENSNKARKTSAGNTAMSSKRKRLNKVTKRTWLLTGEERAKALQRAREYFKPKSPYFMVIMHPSYITKPLAIPYNFAKSFLRERVGKVVLKMLGGKTWMATYTVHHGRKDSTFRSDWLVFVRENNLKVGDICIFELIGGAVLELKVSVYRESECTNHSTPHANGMESPRCLESKEEKQRKEIVGTGKLNHADKPSNGRPSVAAANSLTSTNPSFKVVMTSKNIKYHSVTIPTPFMRSHMKGIGTNTPVNLQLGKRLWPANFRIYPDVGIALLFLHGGNGWSKLARENAIQAGDICIFKLIQSQTNPILLDLSVIKHVD